MTTKIRSLAIAAAFAGVGLAACDDSTGSGDTATLRVLLTDAPSDYIAGAWVDIGEIHLLSDDGAPIVLTEDGTDGLVNLLELQNAATETLAQTEIEPGTYHQIRLIVESAMVELAEGYEFNDGTTEKALFVPSGAQTGIKLNLAAGDDEEGEGGIQIVPGEMVLVLDFDVSQSFVVQGNPNTPAGINGVIFKPTLRVTVNDIAASISGTVATSVDGLSVEGLTVTAEPVEGTTLETYQTQTATAITAADGTYTLHFLVPGTYTVTVAVPEGYVTDPTDASVTVDASEDAAAVDFEIVAGS